MTPSRAGFETRSPSPAWWLALVALCLALTLPLLVVDIPPLGDYPNHLARVFVLAALPGDPILASMFAARWSIIPNLALDLVAPTLIRHLPLHIAGRVMIAAAVLLPVLGAVAYNTALGGRWWGLAVGFIAYNSCLLYGFLNFSLSLGPALLLAAAWIRWRETHPTRTILLAIAGTLVLFTCHLMGLVFFGVLAAAAELSRVGNVRDLARRAAFLALVFTAPAALYAMSALQNLGGDAQFVTPAQKLLQLYTTFSNYNQTLDIITAVLAAGLPATCLLIGGGRFPRPAWVAIAMLMALYLTAPFGWKGTYLLDTRFTIMLGFMLFAGFVPGRWPPPARISAIATLVLLFTFRMAVLTTAWAAHNATVADLRRALAPVRPGQTVYVADAGFEEAPAWWAADPHRLRLSNGVRVDEHLGALALIERKAYWPFLFDNPSQQPIRTLQPYATLAARAGSLPNRTEAVTVDLCGFDYLLMTDADAVPVLPPSRFHLLIDANFAALYAITQCRP